MRGELRSDLRQGAAQAPQGACGAPGGAEGFRAALGAARRAAWMPILSRMAAGALALVGLAAIGAAARRSPELTSLMPQLPVGLAQLSGPVPAAPAASPGASGARPPATADEPPGPARAPPEQPVRAVTPPSDAERPCAEHAASPALRAPQQSLVDLNTADVRQLQRLPGVGAKRAQAIVELRQRLGGFRGASDLLRIRGIGRRTLERMAPLLVVRSTAEDGPAAAEPLTEEREEPNPPRSAAR